LNSPATVSAGRLSVTKSSGPQLLTFNLELLTPTNGTDILANIGNQNLPFFDIEFLSPMSGSKIAVLIFGGTIIAAIAGMWVFFDERGTQSQLAAVDCGGLLPTNFEVQGKAVPVSAQQTCDLMRTVAAMQPNTDRNHNDDDDPWHYLGRMRIRPKDDAWFLVFMARRSENYRPVFSLRHRRGGGWSVIGMFDAAQVLEKLGIAGTIDMAKLKSDSALTPTDQSTPMQGEPAGETDPLL
jgi:hypothetical protein